MVFEVDVSEVELWASLLVGVEAVSFSLLATSKGESVTERKKGGLRNELGSSCAGEDALRSFLIAECGDDGAELAVIRGSCGMVGVERALGTREWKPESVGLSRLPCEWFSQSA